MAREDPQINIRLPAALKAQMEDAAKANNRSTNAEIVSRLTDSIDDEVVAQRMRERAFNRDQTILYVLLDADGMPIAWDEIMLHLGRISKGSGGSIEKIDAVVLSPRDDRPSDARLDAYFELAKRYRAFGKGRSIAAPIKDAAPDAEMAPEPIRFTFKKPSTKPRRRRLRLDD